MSGQKVIGRGNSDLILSTGLRTMSSREPKVDECSPFTIRLPLLFLGLLMFPPTLPVQIIQSHWSRAREFPLIKTTPSNLHASTLTQIGNEPNQPKQCPQLEGDYVVVMIRTRATAKHTFSPRGNENFPPHFVSYFVSGYLESVLATVTVVLCYELSTPRRLQTLN